ncbi:MAG TPA: class III extradiol ring-cleavage dioxygenase, partial [Myxococcota bacterium]|nr:class III extradiol ring-cleavage dioxygenase [Myxococcota bacterium]
MHRRQFLGQLLSGLALACAPVGTTAMTTRMPSIFLAHGSPLLLDDAQWMAQLAGWAGKLPRPTAILVISAHWEQRPVSLSSPEPRALFYDFYGFPAKYYQVRYASPAAGGLAKRVRELLGEVVVDSQRGLDHGAFVPLMAMYPQADIPVLQLSLPSSDPAALIALGRRLAPLREEGVLLMGSGFLTHNMRTIDFSGRTPPPSWAADFDAWCAQTLARRDVDGMVNYKNAPGARISLPTQEHFLPVLVSLGASVDHNEAATFPIEGYTY